MSELEMRDASPCSPLGGVPEPFPTARRWGAFPRGYGIGVVAGTAVLGAVITAASRSQPGLVLGACLLAGTFAAALAVGPRAVYWIIPMPALAYVVTATTAGLISDRAIVTSRAGIVISATQSVASGFLTMTAATAVAALITALRWPRGRRRRGEKDHQAPTVGSDEFGRQKSRLSLSMLRGLHEADAPARDRSPAGQSGGS